MAYNPYTWGDTTPLVKSGYEDSYLCLLKQFPFNAIETRIVDGQYMTFFPKTYCKVNGKSGTGRSILFSHKKIDNDWKLMTCFHDFETGAEVENGVCHSRYIASKDNENKAASQPDVAIWANIPYTDINTAAQTRGKGWLPLNIWDYQFRGLLMLIETLAMGYDGADCQTAIGGADGSMGITHFGITNIWGGVLNGPGFWLRGLDTFNGTVDGVAISNNNIHIVNKNGVRMDTGIAAPGNKYPQDFQTKVVDGQYDLNELLLGKTMVTQAAGSCGDYHSLGGNYVCCVTYSIGVNYGPLCLSSVNPSNTYSWCGFALRKAV